VNSIREAWAEGKPSIGTWSGWLTPIDAERLGRVGYDWAVLDMQHSGLQWETLISTMQALELGGTRAVVRVGWNDPREIMLALDVGAIGVVVPMVSTAEEAEQVASAMRYPPVGIRSNGQVRRQMSHAEANADVVCIVMIETPGGWENVEEIAAVPGVDVLIIGPSDLALALGREQNVVGMHPDALDFMSRVVEAADKHGKAAGTLGFSAEHVQALLERGVRWVSFNEFAGANNARDTIAGWQTQFAK
jgi:4-hydroxy-2-oxoheptanedioate aldolase